MNIYRWLSRAANFVGRPATLIFGGVRRAARVSVETPRYDAFGDDYRVSALAARFGIDVDDLPTINDERRFPNVGDALEVVDVDGTRRGYKVCVDASTGRAWDWAFPTPGRRIVVCATRNDATTQN